MCNPIFRYIIAILNTPCFILLLVLILHFFRRRREKRTLCSGQFYIASSANNVKLTRIIFVQKGNRHSHNITVIAGEYSGY